MEIFIGRITADAKVSTLKDDRKVVNFSIAINDSYKSKESNEPKQLTTYINCSYWMSDKIAKYLTKGSLVEVCGRISVSAWNNMQGEARASLNLHVNSLKLHGGGKTGQPAAATAESVPAHDDLPF